MAPYSHCCLTPFTLARGESVHNRLYQDGPLSSGNLLKGLLKLTYAHLCQLQRPGSGDHLYCFLSCWWTKLQCKVHFSLLEKLIEYEAVHEIRSWEDMKHRLHSDRRCFGFFHNKVPDEPLIFVEVALVNGLADNIQELLDTDAASVSPEEADTAIFYSISSTQEGLKGIKLGNFLIECAAEPADGSAGIQSAIDDLKSRSRDRRAAEEERERERELEMLVGVGIKTEKGPLPLPVPS